jgi:ribosomal-protein-alanine N-acetyltransferase
MKLPDNPLIETKRLILRLITKDDLPALFAVNGDDEVGRYTPHVSWKTSADGEAWFGRVTDNHAKGAALQFVIAPRGGGEAIGTMVLFRFNEPVGSAEIGYSLAREHWGKGFAKEAIAAFVEFGFETMGLKRLDAQIDPRNAASGKVLERAGFKLEGLQRRNFFAKGEFSDTGLYGMLREDPRPLGKP